MATWTDPATHTWATSEVLTAAHLVTFLQQNTEFLYGENTWNLVGAGLQNGWADYGLGTNSTAYRKVGTRVHLRGTVKSGSIGAAIFTIPSGYRPPGDGNFLGWSNAAAARIVVFANGVIEAASGSNSDVSLEGISFDTI